MTAATSMVYTEVKETKAPAATRITDTNPYEATYRRQSDKSCSRRRCRQSPLSQNPSSWPTFMVFQKLRNDSRMKKIDSGFFWRIAHVRQKTTSEGIPLTARTD
jgi:hypothetical protein